MSDRPYNGDAFLEARVRVIEALMIERDKNLGMTAELMNERVKHLNELRGDVITRGEYNRAHQALEDKIVNLNKLGLVLLVTLVGALLAALFALLKH